MADYIAAQAFHEADGVEDWRVLSTTLSRD